ncbi:MAG: PTS system fructose-specific EIIABC component [Chlamydiae bacterium]|nr:PTS system fructose-specific EIIABC component [Chlamydiota bacterium]
MAIPERIKTQITGHLGELKKRFTREEEVTISKYLDEQLVVFLKAESQSQALEGLIDRLDACGKLQDKEPFKQAIVARERLVSTGIGIGVAIPHAKLEGYENFFIAIGIQKSPGIEWNSLDGMPVNIIFMIGGPENRQTEYLRILSLLTHAIKNEERRKQLLKAVSAEEVLAVFQDT